MKGVFVDTLYWVAISRPNDQWREPALQAHRAIGNAKLITTDEVLIEYLNSLSKWGERFREFAVKTVKAILANPNIRVFPQSHESLLKGLDLYADRGDKRYSLTDCISMAVMERESIKQILTHDHNFAQENFEVLITA